MLWVVRYSARDRRGKTIAIKATIIDAPQIDVAVYSFNVSRIAKKYKRIVINSVTRVGTGEYADVNIIARKCNFTIIESKKPAGSVKLVSK
jgi:hypothetical protein